MYAKGSIQLITLALIIPKTSDYDQRVKWMGHMAHMEEMRNETIWKT
jgi:hypothetical protein